MLCFEMSFEIAIFCLFVLFWKDLDFGIRMKVMLVKS